MEKESTKKVILVVIGLTLFTILYSWGLVVMDFGIPNTYDYMKDSPCTMWGIDYHCEDLETLNTEIKVDQTDNSIKSILEAIDG